MTRLRDAPLRLVLCDDHRMLLEALADNLESNGLVVEAISTDVDEAVDEVLRVRPDVCVLDINFPQGGDAIAAAARIVREAPDTDVMLLSAMITPDLVRAAVAVGVRGFARKDDSLAQIVTAIERLASGEVAIEAELFRATVHDGHHPAPAGRSDPLRDLTPREREVLGRIMAGDSTAMLARRLSISVSTARSHVQNVLMKLGVHTRLQAVAVATSRLHPPDARMD